MMACVLALLCLCTAACKTRDYAPEEDVPVPQVTPGVSCAPAPETGMNSAAYLTLTPILGPKIKIEDSAVASLMIDALLNRDAAPIETEGVRFENTCQVFDGQDRLLYSCDISSDGQKLALREDGSAFYVPEYVYYRMQWELWPVAGSMDKVKLVWNPGTQDIAVVLSRLNDVLATIKVQEMGYAQAYFVNYKLYDTVLSDKNTKLKLYMTVSFAGYDVQNGFFMPVLKDTRPAQITFQLSEEGYWLPASYAQAADASDYESVRRVLPYDYAKTGMNDTKQRETMTDDLARQALDYLRKHGIKDMEVTAG